ncbi:MAG: hypothetical protein KL863_13465 [Rhizobium sp.]|nr:hypothetical protein [Rhizobium sp.]
MRKLAVIALAAMVAATGGMSTASASLSDRDGTVWHQKDATQVAARGDRGGRNEGGRGRDARRDNRGKVIWRVRDKHHRQFFLFRGRGDCRTEAVNTHDRAGNPVVRNAWVCN